MAQTRPPLWARGLDTLSDVVFGVAAAVAGLLLVASVAALLDTGDTAVGGWLIDTGVALVGPLDGVVDDLVDIEQPNQQVAVALLAGAVAWGLVGWLAGVLIRPR